eukprot:831597-Rhodomonas_salina.1
MILGALAVTVRLLVQVVVSAHALEPDHQLSCHLCHARVHLPAAFSSLVSMTCLLVSTPVVLACGPCLLH